VGSVSVDSTNSRTKYLKNKAVCIEHVQAFFSSFPSLPFFFPFLSFLVSPFLLGIFEIGSHELFAQVFFKP
jgi:hypothetical protein